MGALQQQGLLALVARKRGGAHERTIRPIKLTRNGVEIGEPLRNYRGVLTGVPIMVDAQPAPSEPSSVDPC